MRRTPITLLCLVATVCVCSGQQTTDYLQQKRDIQIATLDDDLALLEEQIRSAEDDVIEYVRLHALRHMRIRAEAELQTLKFVIQQRTKAEQELLLLEAKHSCLTDTNAPVAAQDADTLRQHQVSLKKTIAALEKSELKWQDRSHLISRRESELRHLQNRVKRLERTYAKLADRRHDLRMKDQLKSLRNEAAGSGD